MGDDFWGGVDARYDEKAWSENDLQDEVGDLLEGGLQNQVSDDVDEQYDLGNVNENGEGQKDEEEEGEHRSSQDDVVDEEDLQKGEGDVEEKEELRLQQDQKVDEDEADEDLLCDGHAQVLCCVHDAHGAYDEKTWNEKNEVCASCDVFVVVAVDEALSWNLGESFALFPLYSRIEIHEFHLRRWLSIQPKK